MLGTRLDMEGNTNTKLHKIDVLKATGSLVVVERPHNLSTFMSKGKTEYNPQILVATSGSINASIDLNKIYCIVRLGMSSE